MLIATVRGARGDATMQTENMRLDGNAAAGSLRDVFASEMTVAVATCAGCGNVGPMGELLEYGHAMGIVLRCPACENVVIRIARDPAWLHVDVSGIAMLTIPAERR
jgi:uncharacterized protein DUF6510